MNTFGEHFSFTSFGESHGIAIGGVLDGVPAGITINIEMIREELDRRAGRGATGTSPRAIREPDEIEWLSGVIEDVQRDNVQGTKADDSFVHRTSVLRTLGTPIAFIIRNKDARPEDYEWLKHSYRVGHADKVYEQKYGIRDWRGGGRASARETAARVVAGGIAKQLLADKGISIHATLVQVGTETNPERFDEVIESVRREGDSIGGIIECTISGMPVGAGEPIFNKLQAELAFAILSINACKGFEYGTGFGGVGSKGSEINHVSGGISGGISDGTPITFRCDFKTTPTTPKALENLIQSNSFVHRTSSLCTLGDQPVKVGRHDACIAVRAVPVVEAMTALCLQNMLTQ